MEALSRHLDRIRACCPDLALSTVRADVDGLVNDVLIVNEELVFRFPKNDRARQALAQEAKILDLVRRHTSMPVPAFEQPDDDLVMYRLIPGSGLNRDDFIELDERTRDQLAEQLATFLWQLHSLPRSLVETHGIGAADSARRPEDWVALYQDAERELFPLLMTHARDWVRRHFAPVLDGRLSLSYEPALVHGDLGPYHILYDRALRRINGVIDFGTGGLGDPADDFANIISALGEGLLRRMSRYYPAIGQALDRARFWAGTLEIQWALAGLRSKDPTWFVVHLGRARDAMPIGQP